MICTIFQSPSKLNPWSGRIHWLNVKNLGAPLSLRRAQDGAGFITTSLERIIYDFLIMLSPWQDLAPTRELKARCCIPRCKARRGKMTLRTQSATSDILIFSAMQSKACRNDRASQYKAKHSNATQHNTMQFSATWQKCTASRCNAQQHEAKQSKASTCHV